MTPPFGALFQDLEPELRARAIAAVRAPRTGLFRVAEPIMSGGDERGFGCKIHVGGMWPSGIRWWNLKNKVRVYSAGYGIGKSRLLCQRHISLALLNDRIPTALVSPTYTMARDIMMPHIETLLDGQIPIQRELGNLLQYELRRSPPYSFTILHQQPRRPPRIGRIVLLSGEDHRKLKGRNLSSAGIDEPFIQDVEVFRQMDIRCREPKAVRREINLAGTPENMGWGADLAEGEIGAQYDVGLVQGSTLENKALKPETVDELIAAFDKKAVQAYVHGQFVNLNAGLVYHAMSRVDNVCSFPRPLGAELGVGMDFNVNPMAATVFWWRLKPRPHIHYFAEYELANSDTYEMAGILREKHWKDGLREVYPDSNCGRSTSSGKTDYKILEEAGFNVNRRIGGNPERRDRFNMVNRMLRGGESGRVGCTFDPGCKRLIRYQTVYCHENIMKADHVRMSHLLDARDYPICILFPFDRSELKFQRIGAA